MPTEVFLLSGKMIFTAAFQIMKQNWKKVSLVITSCKIIDQCIPKP
jgi:hypothetical protein